jgi:hypothetical protein
LTATPTLAIILFTTWFCPLLMPASTEKRARSAQPGGSLGLRIV